MSSIATQLRALVAWQPIETARKDGTYILLRSPSGYVSTPHRADIGKWSDDRNAWVDHSYARITDVGEAPTYWRPIPNDALGEALCKAVEALEGTKEALENCYQVTDWPADGTTAQDDAIRLATTALSALAAALPE